jgi:peptide/nickel transport system permease protein
VVQHLGVSLPQLLSGMLIVEIIFAWPGIGQISFEAVGQRDYAVILAATASAGLLVVLGSLATDLAHVALDPRVRDAQG